MLLMLCCDVKGTQLIKLQKCRRWIHIYYYIFKNTIVFMVVILRSFAVFIHRQCLKIFTLNRPMVQKKKKKRLGTAAVRGKGRAQI